MAASPVANAVPVRIVPPSHAIQGIDFNGDGAEDVDLWWFTGCCSEEGESFTYLFVEGVIASAAVPLEPGTPIGPDLRFSNHFGALAGDDGGFSGAWLRISHEYLGVRFEIDGADHFGWVELSVRVGAYLRGSIHAYGYETLPGTAIAAGAVPEPSTVALLGLAGLIACRLLWHDDTCC